MDSGSASSSAAGRRRKLRGPVSLSASQHHHSTRSEPHDDDSITFVSSSTAPVASGSSSALKKKSQLKKDSRPSLSTVIVEDNSNGSSSSSSGSNIASKKRRSSNSPDRDELRSAPDFAMRIKKSRRGPQRASTASANDDDACDINIADATIKPKSRKHAAHDDVPASSSTLSDLSDDDDDEFAQTAEESLGSSDAVETKEAAPLVTAKRTREIVRDLADELFNDAHNKDPLVKNEAVDTADMAPTGSTDRADEVECAKMLSHSHSSAPAAAPALAASSDVDTLQQRIQALQAELAEAKAKAESSQALAKAQNTVLTDLHGQCVCHICLELVWRPCVLAPCGHIFCIHCLRSWFTKPLESEAPVPSHWSESQAEDFRRSKTLKRKKICPSCRTELACAPVEIWLVRQMLEKVEEGLVLAPPGQPNAVIDRGDLSAEHLVQLKGDDLPQGPRTWDDIFDQSGPRRIIFDEVDGVPRCGHCASEIFEGVCSNPSCGIEYDSDSAFGYGDEGYDDMSEDNDLFPYHFGDMPGRGRTGTAAGAGARDSGREGAFRRIGERIAEFEERHGISEALSGSGGGQRRGGGGGAYADHFGDVYDDEDEDRTFSDEEDDMREMDGFIVRDSEGEDDLDRDEDDEDGMHGDFIDDDDDDDEEADEARVRRRAHRRPNHRARFGAPITISDDEDNDGSEDIDEQDHSGDDETADTEDGSDSSVEFQGRGRSGRSSASRYRRLALDEDEDEDRNTPEEEEEEGEGDDDDHDGFIDDEADVDHDDGLGASTESSRSRRRMIIDDEDEDV
ncbi:hypothetical protein BCV70DRAFT_126097 [Testicularia cyperi]|uniref:RING-type domain-containing protein n=1 Tax=Testicularia cyperi TaxID=1882483 RepID=A0A317XMA3_9BASI|nr:hypothetical protein BCV70DRAFT_126097 [Testicularia cyperi]